MKFILLSYINRSGSTYLANLLSKIPGICVCPEADILFDLFLEKQKYQSEFTIKGKLLQLIESDKKWKHWKCNISDLKDSKGTGFELFLKILDLFRRTHYPSSNCILFKYNHLINLKNTDPESYNVFWINLIRHPFSIYASQKATLSPATGKVMSKNPLAFIDYWNGFFNKYMAAKNSAACLQIKYEDVVQAQDNTMQLLLNYAQIEQNWSDVKSNSGYTENWLSKDYRKIHSNINKAPDNTSIHKWKNQLTKYEMAVLTKKVCQQNLYEIKPIDNYPTFYLLYYLWCKVGRKITFLKSKFRLIFRAYV